MVTPFNWPRPWMLTTPPSEAFGNSVVVDAAYLVAKQPGGALAQNKTDLSAFQGQTSRHDQADIARTQNNRDRARQTVFDVHEILRGACGHDACGSRSGYEHLAA